MDMPFFSTDLSFNLSWFGIEQLSPGVMDLDPGSPDRIETARLFFDVQLIMHPQWI